jgi:GNAT superfamily N-acetyltransferase
MTPSSAMMANEVVLSQIEEEDSDRVISETVRAYRAHGLGTKWCVGHWTKPDTFGECLLQHGFRAWDVRGMGCPPSLRLDAEGHVSVEAVREQNLDEYLAVMFRGWGLPSEEVEIERCAHLTVLSASPQDGFPWLARIDGIAVGTGALVVRGDYGYLLGTQVLSAARGRGAYRALVAARLEFLRRGGIEYPVTQAREEASAPMLEHLGFETLFRSKCYVLEAAASS